VHIASASSPSLLAAAPRGRPRFPGARRPAREPPAREPVDPRPSRSCYHAICSRVGP